MSLGRDQVSIRRRTFDGRDSRNTDNPLGGVFGVETNPVVEMVDIRSSER